MKVSRRVEFKTESYAVGDVIKIKTDADGFFAWTDGEFVRNANTG